MVESVVALVAEGRIATEDHAWQRAFDAFTAAGGSGVLDNGDPESYWTAAYLIGDIAAAIVVFDHVARLGEVSWSIPPTGS